MIKKSYWRWWLCLLGFVVPILINDNPFGPTVGDFLKSAVYGIILFFIGWMIDIRR